jgi:hypothetical protein
MGEAAALEDGGGCAGGSGGVAGDDWRCGGTPVDGDAAAPVEGRRRRCSIGEAAVLEYWGRCVGGDSAGVLGGGAAGRAWEAAREPLAGGGAGGRPRCGPAATPRCGLSMREDGGDGRPNERIGLEELDRLWRWGERKNKFEWGPPKLTPFTTSWRG